MTCSIKLSRYFGKWNFPPGTRRSACRRIGLALHALVLSLALCLVAGVYAQTSDWVSVHAEAIQLYRAGNASAAMAKLRPLLTQTNVAAVVQHDAVEIAYAAGNPAEALTIAQPLLLNDAPNYALAVIGRAAREARAFSRSRAAYAELLRRDPSSIDARVGQALAYIAEGTPELATGLLGDSPESGDVALRLSLFEARALHAQALGNDVDVLRWSGDMLALQPENVSAARLQFSASLRLGLPHIAASLLDTRELPAAERLRLGRDLLVSESRYQLADESAAALHFRLDTVLDSLAAFAKENSDHEEAMRARWDWIALANVRGLREAAYAQLAPLLVPNATFPAWFESTIGQVLLANRRPTESLRWFEGALKRGVDDPATHAGYFYALMEAERIDDAQAVARNLHLKFSGEARAKNIDPLLVTAAALQVVRSEYFADQVLRAWNTLSLLRLAAPANREINRLYIDLLNARGQHRAASDHIALMRGESPNDVGFITQRAATLIQRGDRVGGARGLDHARALDPYARGPLREQRELERHRAPTVRLDFGLGRSSADDVPTTTINATRERQMEATVSSGWWRDQWQAHIVAAQSRDDRGEAQIIARDAALASVQWSGLDVAMSAGVVVDKNPVKNTYGATLRASTTLNDDVGLSISAGRNDFRLPLRAWGQGVSMSYVNVGASWRLHDHHRVNVNGGHALFSDGNRRKEVNVAYHAALWRHAHTRVDARVDVYRSANRSAAVAYFSPLQRTGVIGALATDWVNWRDYDRSFTQTAALTVGRDWQQGFADTDVRGARYGHRWRFNACTELSYGVEWLRRGYDGVSETKRSASMTLLHRFLP